MQISNDQDTGKMKVILWSGLALLALGQALQYGNGALTSSSLVMLTLAILFSALGIASSRLPFPKISKTLVWFVLASGLLLQIVQLVTALPIYYGTYEFLARRWQFQVLVALAGFFALTSLAPQKWIAPIIRKIAFSLVLASMLLAGIWVIKASPHPFIDVFMFHQTSAEALMNHQNPYELSGPNIYGNMTVYGPELVKDGRMTIGNPYPPLSIYLSSLGYFAAGNIRYSHLIAILLTALLIASFSNNRFSLLSAYLFLFTPRVFFILEQSWTEPLVLLLAALTIWTAIHHPKWTFVALGLLFACKQTMLLLFPLSLLLLKKGTPWKNWVKPAVKAAASAFAVTAPLAFANLQKFIWDVGLVQFYQVFRFDALSYLSTYALITGKIPSQYIAFGMLILAFLFVFKYAQHSPAWFALSSAFCLMMFFAFSKQAFANYYFLVIGLLVIGMSAIHAMKDDALQHSMSESSA